MNLNSILKQSKKIHKKIVNSTIEDVILGKIERIFELDTHLDKAISGSQLYYLMKEITYEWKEIKTLVRRLRWYKFKSYWRKVWDTNIRRKRI